MPRKGDGLFLRRSTWYLDCRLKGTRHVVWLGKGITRSVAREIAQVKRGAILKGEEGIGKKRKDIAFEEAAKKFLMWGQATNRPRTVRSYRECLARLSDSFSGKRLSEITPWLIEKHKQVRKEAGAPVRANRELAVLKTLFNRSREWGFFEGENPVCPVKFFKEPKQRLRFLEYAEEDKLLQESADHLRSIIVLGTSTGLRIRAEALTLRWEDVDLMRGLITVQAAFAKSGETRTVPINAEAREMLERLAAHPNGDYVFAKPNGQPYRSIRTAFLHACKLAGLRGVTLHTLRHTWATRMASAGVNVRTLQELGGWKELAMVERYAHVTASDKAEAVERIVRKKFHNIFHNMEQKQLATGR